MLIRSVELIALLVISCIFFLFCMHTNKLNSRLKEMEMKLHPSEFSALGLTGDGVGVEVGGSSSGSNSNHLDSSKPDNINTLHRTYQYLKSTGQVSYQSYQIGIIKKKLYFAKKTSTLISMHSSVIIYVISFIASTHENYCLLRVFFKFSA
uniref:Uncharacterized protein n=1 Tax=Glossina palpalis gambiensis TaxID=67801 RepID=A0A1B0BCI1_9MUSC